MFWLKNTSALSKLKLNERFNDTLGILMMVVLKIMGRVGWTTQLNIHRRFSVQSCKAVFPNETIDEAVFYLDT